MPDSKVCSQCHAEIPPDAPGELCPACLLARDEAAFTRQQLAELNAAFPQLELIELIGRGGMGEVYKARQKRLNRLVALKILPPPFGRDDGLTARFLREAQALASLNHPHIVTVHDFGESEGLCYFVMEFIDGTDLKRLIDSKSLTPAEALAIVPQICDALQYAHHEGVVHRDIKPGNILLDKKGRVKVADFGLAKIVRAENLDPHLTLSGQALGTPLYMAPEQREHPLEVDHRADIYSLGVVLYEMLTGELPVGRFQLPSEKVQVDVRLDEVVLRSLEKDRERRYQHVSEVKTRVEQVSNAPGAAPPPGLAPPAKAGAGFLATASLRFAPGVYAACFGAGVVAWLLILLAWNGGVWSVALACVLSAGLLVALLTRLRAGFPLAEANWRGRSRGSRLKHLGAAWLYGALGVWLLTVAGSQQWERLLWNPAAVTPEEFLTRYRGDEHKLLRQLPALRENMVETDLDRVGFSWSAGWILAFYNSPSIRSFGAFPVGGSAVLGFLLVAAVAGCLFDPRGKDGKPRYGWPPAYGFAAAVLAAGAILFEGQFLSFAISRSGNLTLLHWECATDRRGSLVKEELE
ncbi:MAG: serine/threonine protein kinase, partial [Verrucomicrobiota bacterium]|nr:serine/threonine protein kinase [Verrucomicrobiota bacterium]